MAGMKKVYDDLIIINLQGSRYHQSMDSLSVPVIVKNS